jgi:protein SCO1/2
MTAAGAAVLVLGALPSSSQDSGERSIYRLQGSWTQDDGKPLRLDELRGEPQVLTLFYTTCTGSCPITVKALQMFSEGEKSAGRARVRFVLITVDPAQDTLKVLRKYRRTMHLEKDSWRLLRGKDSDVRKMAALLGFNFEQIDSGEFMHSNLITVLDTRGQIVHQQSGIAGDIAALREAIERAKSGKRASRERTPPTRAAARNMPRKSLEIDALNRSQFATGSKTSRSALSAVRIH